MPQASECLQDPTYLRIPFTATFVRSGKLAPEIGPQASGVTPLLRQFQMRPRNNWPTATCTARTVDADIPTDQAVSAPAINPIKSEQS